MTGRDAADDISGRWHVFRERQVEELKLWEGEAWFVRRQRYLATATE